MSNKNRHSKEEVLSYCKNLRDTNISVSEQFPSEIRARRAAQIDTLKEHKRFNNKVKLSVDQLDVNNRYVDPHFSLNPLSNSTTNMIEDPPELSTPVNISENGSTFKAYASRVLSTAEANTALQKVHAEEGMGSVTHISYAYSISDGNFPLEGHDDGGEYGLSDRLMRIISGRDLSNVFVAVARWHKGPNLGERRFQLACNAAESSLETLAEEVTMETADENETNATVNNV